MIVLWSSATRATCTGWDERFQRMHRLVVRISSCQEFDNSDVVTGTESFHEFLFKSHIPPLASTPPEADAGANRTQTICQ